MSESHASYPNFLVSEASSSRGFIILYDYANISVNECVYSFEFICKFVCEFCRYADFIVNEVDLDGNVVHLTTLVAPPEVILLLDISSCNRVGIVFVLNKLEMNHYICLCGQIVYFQ